ncbi:unnamed protein product [Arabidopsis lyrata]|uniref:Predicted protein n=1 Tax=Arabidopsis lyrata subsp. lyrata TaxID=81972 RepID=D7LUV3_ARALL|nr:uncharacterized protein LOC9312327 [Arabidopsis lyrata subsp. lyrata]EFH54246.1 predicted protein [Arabidopsis lyrata subsp. lyrata]CAH8268611.1 unnamed protein product [Arabidopsis lyrata]|eukprot:XP_002877987.1 uncharacterized protein LOC9312327 [Arabidopsis lyrata subsp. lyrata]
MPFRSKVQPININGVAMRQAPRSRLKRLFERQFSLKNLAGVDSSLSRSNPEEFEPSSVCLRRMVQNYIEDPDSETQSQCIVRNHFNCFSGSGTDSSDEDEESSSSSRVLRSLKSLLLCANVSESDLETKASEIVKREVEDKSRLKNVADELVALGYDAAICKSRWEKSKLKSYRVPAGDHEYLDVNIGGERVLIDIDFQSKFKIAKPTKTYESISKTLPNIFVGQVERLKKVVVFVSKAAKKSFKKKGLFMPPWRRAEYLLTKWVSQYDRAKQTQRETSGEAGAAEN